MLRARLLSSVLLDGQFSVVIIKRTIKYSPIKNPLIPANTFIDEF